METGNSLNKDATITVQHKSASEYWRDKLLDLSVACRFPYDDSVETQSNNDMEVLKFCIPSGLNSRLFQMSNHLEERLHVILTAALTVLLSKYTGMDEVILGTPVSAGDPEMNSILVLKSRLNQSITFKELVFQVREEIRESSAYQNFPIRSLARKSEILGREKEFYLFDTAVLLKPFQKEGYLEGYASGITFVFTKSESELSGQIVYQPQLYRPSTIESIATRYVTVLQKSVENLNLSVAKIGLFKPEEEQLLLREYYATRVDYPPKQTFLDLFKMQVEKNPHCKAVEFMGESLSYEQLDVKSNAVACHLREKKLADESVIGLLSDRSLEMCIGILGILKAGYAYLPLNPLLPPHRIRYMVNDGKVRVVLSGIENAEGLKMDAEILALSEICKEDGITDKSILPEVYCENLAYVIYTSGSTGYPKGVMIEHKALVNFLHSIYHSFSGKVEPKDRCMSLTSISFDVSVCEIFMPLAFGACLVLYDNEFIGDVKRLGRFIIEKEINFAYIPPTILKDLAAYLLSSNAIVKLDKMLVGVEPISDYAVEDYFKLNSHLQVINGYGPTEATICATFYKYTPGNPTGKKLPIGKPLPNTGVYILDKNSIPVPAGVVGELCIYGKSLAKGYLNQPDLTKESFVANPFDPEEKIYRTGDYAKWLDDGNIEYIGRRDYQLKVRGYRIELSEIEEQLLRNESIKSVAVVAKENESNEKYLCAYYTADTQIGVPEVREYLTTKLPDYMIPSNFMQLDEMPLTLNGKIDRDNLPEINEALSVGYVAPQSELEYRLVNIWSDILNLDSDKISTAVNFFDIGGYSLKALQLVNQIQNEFAVTVDLGILFRNPTVTGLASFIESKNPSPQAGILREEQAAFIEIPKALAFSYQYKNDGRFDDVLEKLSCWEKGIYYSLKLKYDFSIATPYCLFINESSLFISLDEEGELAELGVMLAHANGDIIEIKKHEKQSENPLNLLESLLKQGEPVILETVVEKLKFLKFYRPDFNIQAFQPGHVFLAVHHDSDYLYYVEDEFNLNLENHLRYPNNRTIGMVPKRDLIEAFAYYLNCYTVVLKEDNIFKIKERVPELIRQTVWNYEHMESERVEGIEKHYGRVALVKLITLCESGRFQLDRTVPSFGVSLFHVLELRLLNIYMRRQLLYSGLKEYFDGLDEIDLSVLDATFQKDIDAWMGLKKLINDKYNQSFFDVAAEVKKQLSVILSCEDRLFEYLDKLYKEYLCRL